MNNVSIIGRLTRDPELRYTPDGTPVCSLRIAVDGAGGRDSQGEYQAGFFNVSVWREQGERCAQYLAKGRQVGVSGSLTWREWEQDGNKRQAVDITGFRVDFIGPKPEGGDSETPPAMAAAAAPSADDDIPF